MKKKDEKRKVVELLTNEKWYYQSVNNNTCFNSDYWEFKTDGTFDENRVFGDGTYTFSEDGKTIQTTFDNGTKATFSNISISNTSFSFILTFDDDFDGYTIVLSKIANICASIKE